MCLWLPPSACCVSLRCVLSRFAHVGSLSRHTRPGDDRPLVQLRESLGPAAGRDAPVSSRGASLPGGAPVSAPLSGHMGAQLPIALLGNIVLFCIFLSIWALENHVICFGAGGVFRPVNVSSRHPLPSLRSGESP